MSDSILPKNSTPQELALEQTASRYIPDLINTLWHPDRCPAELLGYLAWGLAIDIWDDNWDEATKRNVIREAIHVHEHIGTPGSLKRALQAMGYDHVEIIEGGGNVSDYDGSHNYDGSTLYGGQVSLFEFDVVLHTQNITTTAEINEIKRRINHYKNARSHLRQLRTYNALYNGSLSYNGNTTYNGGIV